MTDAQHGRPTREEPLTPDDVPRPSHAERARTLVDGQRTGTLATLAADGTPYASYVTVAFTDGSPVLLMSTMAEHTSNLLRDARCSLMVHESVAEDPLANGRVTLLGSAQRLSEPGPARTAFLAAHPNASYYADFKDFSFWQLAVESLRYIGGYGRMSWVDAADWAQAQPDPLAPHERGIVDHMNADHADALVTYARAFTRATAATQVQMVSCDQYGFELSVETAQGPRPARIAFREPIHTSEAARKALVALLQEARAQLAKANS